ICHFSTQAVLTRSPEIEVGSCRTEFLRILGLAPSGGTNGTFGRVNRTLLQLANSSIKFRFDEVDAQGRPVHGGIRSFDPLASYEFWFNWKGAGGQTTLWNSTVRLTDEFFQDLVQHAFPISMDALRQLQRSGMAIDIYTWAAYRMFSLRRPLTLPWEVLEAQFGGTYSETRFFRRDFIRHLIKVKEVYPALRVEPKRNGLLMLPSPTPIPSLSRRSSKRLSVHS
ncbi:MAG: replication protein RepA, partial [Candidatus Dormibacteria bacterium]